jgi:hypothetical protein
MATKRIPVIRFILNLRLKYLSLPRVSEYLALMLRDCYSRFIVG